MPRRSGTRAPVNSPPRVARRRREVGDLATLAAATSRPSSVAGSTHGRARARAVHPAGHATFPAHGRQIGRCVRSSASPPPSCAPARWPPCSAHGAPPHPEIMLGTTYLRAIDAAGGIPVILAPVDLAAVPELVARLDGICLAGGPDLDPVAYGAADAPPAARRDGAAASTPSSSPSPAPPTRAGLPLLGICRGAQALNVARGGTLHQHVDGHRQTELATVAHAARRRRGRLAAGRGHRRRRGARGQLVPPPGRRRRPARACASSPGRPTGRSRPSRTARARFVLGVQWHAETLTERPEHGALFAALVQAAGARPLRLAAAA